MNVILDTCASGDAVEALRAAGFQVEWIGAWEKDPGDDALLRIALDRSAVVVTLDKDFGELAVLHERSHCGIVRLVDLRAAEHGPCAVAALRKYADDLPRGAIVTVERHRVRVRPGNRPA